MVVIETKLNGFDDKLKFDKLNYPSVRVVNVLKCSSTLYTSVHGRVVRRIRS